MKTPVFTGCATAIITPFTEDGINFDKLGELIEFQIANCVDAIVICGTSGEASTMTDSEHLSAIKYAVEKVNKRVPVIAGTGSNDTRHCINLSVEAEKRGSDALLIVTPYYNKTTQKGLVEHFREVVKNVSIPIIVYNVPSRTGMTVTAKTCLELSLIDNVVGLKDASGNISLVAEIAAVCSDNLTLYSGNDDMIVPLLSLGGKGVISVVSNILPKETHDMCELYLTGEVEKSRNLQLKMLNLINSLFIEVNPIPIKTAMNLLGYNVGKLRLPLCEMSENNLLTLKKALIDYGLLLY